MMLYIASPYSSEDPHIVERRVDEVTLFVGRLLELDLVPFSPIIYCHDLARDFNLPTDAEYWHHFNMSILRRCDAMLVLKLDGWRESIGVNTELKAASLIGLPVYSYEARGGSFYRSICEVPTHLPPEIV